MSQHSKRTFSFSEMLFKESLDQLILSIQSMKSSEDIQSGIYLDIMGKSEKDGALMKGRHSSKSMIS